MDIVIAAEKPTIAEFAERDALTGIKNRRARHDAEVGSGSRRA